MNLISMSGVSKTFRDEPLFRDVTLGIDAGERIGFVGANGTGKSTFLRLLRGELEPDTGTVARNRSLTVSALDQRPDFHAETIVDDFLAADGVDGVDGAAGAPRRSLLDAGRSLCRELGVTDTGAAMGSLSGGTVRKVALARCLARGASFVTLDEPTNHLDLDTIEWLEARLRAASFGFVVVSHDRAFLDAVCGAILEIDDRRVYKYPGTYADYLDRKADRAAARERAEERRSTILRRELEWLRRGPKARTGKDKGRKARIENLLDGETRRALAMREFSSAHRRLGKKVLELDGVAKGYGGRTVVRPFSYGFRRGERIGIVGPNGSGKTTFLRLVSGVLAPDAGSVAKGENTVFATFEQTAGGADSSLTVIDYIRRHGERIAMADGTSVSAEQFLERFLFPRTMQASTLGRLSGGELRRLELVSLLATAPNFLLLDEPTNDLDLDTIRLLEDYLDGFPGCILVVSHDRALLERTTDYLFLFEGDGSIRGFAGSWAAYRELRAEERALAAPPAASAATAERRSRTAREPRSALSFKERREVEGLLHEIDSLEREKGELEAFFLLPARDGAEAAAKHRRYREVEAAIAEKMARWESLAARAEE